MHRIAAMPGGWNPQEEGVVYIDQTPAPIVFITSADTDIQVLASAWAHLPQGFPEVRAVNLLALQQQLTIDTYGSEGWAIGPMDWKWCRKLRRGRGRR
jgi:cobaltochelatase CobN